jgi:hypothetical protein
MPLIARSQPTGMRSHIPVQIGTSTVLTTATTANRSTPRSR